jgi:hypothetical protein
MKKLTTEILRWCIIAASGGYGVWQLVYAGWRIATRWEGGWFDVFFFLLFPTLVAAPFLAIAYICLRRQYRKLFLVLGVVGAVALFGLLMALPDQMGIAEYVHHNLDTIDKMRAHRWLDFLAGPFFLLCLFGPIYAAAWFYRLCRYLAYRGSPGWEKRIRVKTRATRWLVWLGLLCMLLPAMVGMIVTFNRLVQSPNAPLSPGSVANSLDWIIGFTTIGILLIFLGLVHRQPVLKHGEDTPPPEPA